MEQMIEVEANHQTQTVTNRSNAKAKRTSETAKAAKAEARKARIQASQAAAAPQISSQEGKRPEPAKSVSAPANKTENAKNKTPKVEPKKTSTGARRYEGSAAQKWDNALLTGGTLDKLATDLGINKGTLRAHAKYRVKSGKFTLSENEGFIKLTRVAAAA